MGKRHKGMGGPDGSGTTKNEHAPMYKKYDAPETETAQHQHSVHGPDDAYHRHPAKGGGKPYDQHSSMKFYNREDDSIDVDPKEFSNSEHSGPMPEHVFKHDKAPKSQH